MSDADVAETHEEISPSLALNMAPFPVPKVRTGLSLPGGFSPATAEMSPRGIVMGIIQWAEHFSPLRLNFDDLTGIQQDVPVLKLDENHEIHVCQFCLHAKQTPMGLKDCGRNKHAVNWLILRRRRGIAGYCHLGLFDMAEPLIVDGRILGVFYFGSISVEGMEQQARERIFHYCHTRQLDPASYFRMMDATPRIRQDEIPVYREFLRSLTAMALQCCQAAGVRAADYKPMIRGIRYRPHDEMPYLVKAAIRYVQQHLQEPFTVKDIAAHLSCHPNYLSKQFKKHMQIELAVYTSQLRIAHAAQIMGNPRLSISQVADESGFGDRVYFGKVFRRATGMTPGQYRKHLVSQGACPKPRPV